MNKREFRQNDHTRTSARLIGYLFRARINQSNSILSQFRTKYFRRIKIALQRYTDKGHKRKKFTTQYRIAWSGYSHEFIPKAGHVKLGEKTCKRDLL